MTHGDKKQPHQIKQADIERVMEVAGRLFAENGYDGVGIRKIGMESGINSSSILYHFGTKASLYEEILDGKYKAFYEMILRAIEPLHYPQEKLECIIGTSFDLLLRDPIFLMLMQRDIVDTTAHKQRPAFIKAYSESISLHSKLLQATLNRPIEKHVTLSLISVTFGYAVLAVMEGHGNLINQEEADWYAKLRSNLIAVGKSILRM